MIAKGTQHNNAGRLASYLTTAKPGETAELYQLRGFGTNVEIKDAFRDVHIMAQATKAQQPFFHVQVRLPDGEKLTRQQWEKSAGRIERMLGLKDQPRAIAFHIDKKTGEEHMHVAWSRIDADTMKSIPLPFYKQRLKTLCRELELHFGLTQISNRRESEIKYAPTRAEDEQARRLGVDIHATRNTIRTCYDHSDCGRAFNHALADEGLTLAQGERRDYVVIDQAGGLHALGKRILGATAAQVREKLADLDRGQMPAVEQAREHLLTRELADVKKQIEAAQQPAPIWDRDAANREWEEAVIGAAIENGNTGGAGGKKHDAQHEPELTGPAAHIREARQHSDNPQAFLAGLAEHGIDLAKATRADAAQSQLDSAEATVRGYWKPTFREGEIVAVAGQGQVWKLTPHTTGDKDSKDIQNFLGGLGTPMPSILDVQQQRQRTQGIEDLKPHGRRASGPLRGGMVEHQAWAMDRVKAADEYRRKEQERRAAEAAQKTTGEVDPQRYLTDPDYRRQVKSDRSYKTAQERKAQRENDLRALMEQQDRQR